MNSSSSRGIKLTTVILAVLVLAISALLSTGSAADNKDVVIEQTDSELVI
ncbi:hypothetical protein [Colwellia sp. MB02u-9]|nr:hypothetical protein [Colwellia sp. MB02u-9]MBA6296906.1 hypothetical protein [Colwellia sp. MB02u-9]